MSLDRSSTPEPLHILSPIHDGSVDSLVPPATAVESLMAQPSQSQYSRAALSSSTSGPTGDVNTVGYTTLGATGSGEDFDEMDLSGPPSGY